LVSWVVPMFLQPGIKLSVSVGIKAPKGIS
jgi:hypothetical protein